METPAERTNRLGEENRELNQQFSGALDSLIKDRLVGHDVPSQPYPVDPFSLDLEDRAFDELSPKERFDLGEIIFSRLGIEPLNLDDHIVDRYRVDQDDVIVYEYSEGDQSIYLQEIIRDGDSIFWLGPKEKLS